MERFELLEKMLEHFSKEDFLDVLVKQMSDHEFQEAFEYITRMHEINLSPKIEGE